MTKRISCTIPEKTIKQLKDLQDFYLYPDQLGMSLNTSRLIVLSVNHLWNYVFNTKQND